jgi:hypothetical protein
MSSETNNPPPESKKISDTNLPELFNLAFKIGDWLNTLWNFYFVIVIGVVGWVITKTPSWSGWQKIAFCCVLALALIANLVLIFKNFDLLKLITADIEAEFKAGSFFKTEALDKYFQEISGRVRRVGLLLICHLIVDVFVIYLVCSLTQ